jgi:hypothetical protein
MEQEKRNFKQQDVFVPWRKLNKKFDQGEVNSEEEEKRGQSFQGFYHVFVKGELEDLLSEIPEMELVEQGYDKHNWYIIAQKKVQNST